VNRQPGVCVVSDGVFPAAAGSGTIPPAALQSLYQGDGTLTVFSGDLAYVVNGDAHLQIEAYRPGVAGNVTLQ
jgi:hypothetical protein